MQDYRINPDSGMPLVHQVANSIRTQIARSELSVGDPLPSVRELGSMLAINFNTVAKAYRLLEKEGLIEIKHGLGARIKDTQSQAGLVSRKEIALDNLQELISTLTLSGADQDDVVDIFAEAIGRHYGNA